MSGDAEWQPEDILDDFSVSVAVPHIEITEQLLFLFGEPDEAQPEGHIGGVFRIVSIAAHRQEIHLLSLFFQRLLQSLHAAELRIDGLGGALQLMRDTAGVDFFPAFAAQDFHRRLHDGGAGDPFFCWHIVTSCNITNVIITIVILQEQTGPVKGKRE